MEEGRGAAATEAGVKQTASRCHWEAAGAYAVAGSSALAAVSVVQRFRRRGYHPALRTLSPRRQTLLVVACPTARAVGSASPPP